MKNYIRMLAITGGPCGGKSTFLAKAHQWLQSRGIRPIVISETATELIKSGLTPRLIGSGKFEELLLGYQIEREKIYLSSLERIAKKELVVILCDRGALDIAAYVEKKVFTKICKKLGYSSGDLMNRYKLVVHLTTAAIGAEDFYTLKNNPARFEGIDESRILDKRTQQAWLGHPHHIIVDNRTDFNAKIFRALQSLARGLNMPKPMEKERKYKVLNFDLRSIPMGAVAIQIIQDYLMGSDKIERRVRLSKQAGQKTYYYTEKTETGVPGFRYEEERIINQIEYKKLLEEKDRRFYSIKKVRYCFVWSGHRFELDFYHAPLDRRGLAVLEVELSDIDEKIDFPSGWQLREVTEDNEYRNKSLARIDKAY